MQITNQTDKAPLLRDLPSRLLGQTAALASRVVSDALAAEGAHRHHIATLATLDAFGASSQADLCRRTDIDRSDMTALISALETEGSVTRGPDKDNRRQNVIMLTAKGRARFSQLKVCVADAQERVLEPLAKAERKELVRLLQILHDHLSLRPKSMD
jgi:MarR family transcriptional regulator, lower aerobic nicotinate degradation pathway regulator